MKLYCPHCRLSKTARPDGTMIGHRYNCKPCPGSKKVGDTCPRPPKNLSRMTPTNAFEALGEAMGWRFVDVTPKKNPRNSTR